jgi:hypothetical protein
VEQRITFFQKFFSCSQDLGPEYDPIGKGSEGVGIHIRKSHTLEIRLLEAAFESAAEETKFQAKGYHRKDLTAIFIVYSTDLDGSGWVKGP